MAWSSDLKRSYPANWTIVKLDSLCKLRNGINYDKSVMGDHVYKIVNVRNITATSLLINENDCDDIILQQRQGDKYLLSDADIIIARSGTPGATRLLVHPLNDVLFCGFIICCTPNLLKYRNYLCCYLKQLEGTSATTTGGSILQNVSQDTLKRLDIVLPPDDILCRFDDAMTKILVCMDKTMNETRRLIEIRDWLLPMLMNGQATLAD